MPKLILRGAYIRYADIRRDDEAGMFTRVHFTADFSEPVREAMEWGEPPSSIQSAKLDGNVTATHLILTPNGRELKQHELQLDVTEVADFQYFRVKDGESNSTHAELRFIVRTPVDGAGALIEQYIRHIGKGPAQLRINYEEQAVMDLAPGESKQVELGDGTPATITRGTELEGQDEDFEPAKAAGPSLAPAALVGGTHQRGTRGRPPRNREREAFADGSGVEIQ